MASLAAALRSISNDYAPAEERFRLVASAPLVSEARLPSRHTSDVALSVVIPAYSTHAELPRMLAGLTRQTHACFEVIVVDDASERSLDGAIRAAEIDVPVKYVRIDANPSRNPSHARNVGIACADASFVVCLDSDLIVASDFLERIALRLELVPRAVFVGFRANIDPKSPPLSALGYAPLSGDWRHTAHLDERTLADFLHVNLNGPRHQARGTLHILEETNQFRHFGEGRALGYWDLPAMVIGHTLAFDRGIAQRAGGFPEIFRGWGIEDIAFGARMIAEECWIIPALDCVSFHQRRDDEFDRRRKTSQLRDNLQRYFALANETDSAPRFPNIGVELCEKTGMKSFFRECT